MRQKKGSQNCDLVSNEVFSCISTLHSEELLLLLLPAGWCLDVVHLISSSELLRPDAFPK